MKSTLISAYSIEELVEEVDEKIKRGIKPSLAFVYSSVSHDIRALVTALNKYSFDIVGSTTVGEVFADDEFGVQEREESIVCMLVEVNSEAIALKLLPLEGDDYHATGKQIGLWAKSQFDDVSIITHTSGLMFDTDAYVQGILSTGIVHAFGASAGDDFTITGTFVFSSNNFTGHGAVVLALDNSKIDIIGSRAFGWVGIGKEKIVTKASKNIVYEIDNRPAFEFYKTYLQVQSSDMPIMGMEYPLEVRMGNGQIVYRAVLDIDNSNGSLIFAGHVEEKSKVRLSAPQGKDIMKYVDKSITKSIEENKNFQAELGLVFPCASRKQVLGPFSKEEIAIAYKASNCPIVGFYAYGEIGAFPGGYGFHNETFVTALLKEKE